MSEMLGNIGSFFGSPAGKGLGEVAGLGATGAGLVGNLAADHQRSIAAKEAQANANLTPQQLSEMVTKATQPLNRGLVQAITGNVNANLAEQGLSQAPGIQATTLAQALALPEQQNQQTALQLVMRKLGLPAEFASTIPQNAQLAPLIAMLFQGAGNFPKTSTPGKSPTGGAAGSYPTMPYPIPTGGAMPQPNLPIDWLGMNPLQENIPPEMTPPDVGY
jgi:hypothetical protein